MMFRARRAKIPLFHEREQRPIKVVGDAAIAAPHVAEGRLIPLVILDTAERPDIEEYIRAHEFHGPGDVKSQWGRSGKSSSVVSLILTFINPTELVAIVDFDIARQGIIVEQILATKGLYLQAGKAGDRLKHDLNKPKVIIEIPDTGFRPIWGKLFFKAVTQEMRKQGLDRHRAKRAAEMAIEELRKSGQFRVPTLKNSNV